ncbi:hypothetical protein KGM_200788 [Danaus plexippus plexippus]|uniref:Uncharacterized protein n=1 Tax=Danaus plexippus plexippus TaxID=278856 RepID=A0A212FH42_DANPL|nr:hypothetical protein KGM_200788 [Danaus plexippus plexippus]
MAAKAAPRVRYLRPLYKAPDSGRNSRRQTLSSRVRDLGYIAVTDGPGPGAYRGSNYDYGYDNDNYDNDGYYYDDNYYNDRYYNRYRYPYRRSGLGLGAGLDLSLGRYY